MTDTKRISFVSVPDGAADALRLKFGVPEGEKLRLCYLSIADDAARVQQNWVAGREDPDAIKQAHAAQFFEAAEHMGAEGLMFSCFDTEPVDGHPVSIAQIGAFPNKADKAAVRRKLVEVEGELARFDPHVVIMAQSLPVWVVPQIASKYRTVLFLGSLQWPLAWGAGRISIKERSQIIAHKLRGKRYLRDVRGIVSGSKAGLAQALSMAGRKLPSAWDIPQLFGAYPFRERMQARKLIVCGPIYASNAVFDVLEVFRGLNRDVPDMELVFAGYGADAERLAEAADDLPNVRVEVPVNDERFRDLIAQADLCIESFGRASHHGALDMLYAAGLSGVPALVSTAVPLQPFQEDTSHRFDAADTSAMKSALERLVKDDHAFRELAAGLPYDRTPYYDKKHSFGSGLVRVLQEIDP